MSVRATCWITPSPWSLLPQDDTLTRSGSDLPLPGQAQRRQPTTSTDSIAGQINAETIPLITEPQLNARPWDANTGTEPGHQNRLRTAPNEQIGIAAASKAQDTLEELIACSELLPERSALASSSKSTISPSPLLDLSLTFLLQSRPGASKVIYLDFNGHTTSGTSWNDSTMGSSFYSPAYGIDGNPSLFSDAELIRIQQTWQRVADNFSPFDVNVTLQEPPADWLAQTGGTDSNWGARCVITSHGPSSSSAGGIAFIGSFNDRIDTPSLCLQSKPDRSQ
jgi:hypothetical protein